MKFLEVRYKDANGSELFEQYKAHPQAKVILEVSLVQEEQKRVILDIVKGKMGE